MKKWILNSLLVLIISTSSFAQNRMCKMNRGKIKAQRVAYITESLNLTVKEAQSFWPVYNKYTNALEALRRKNHQNMRKAYNNPETSDYEKILKEQYLSFDKEAQLKKEYQKALEKILPKQKIVKLYQAEGNFKRNLIREMKK